MHRIRSQRTIAWLAVILVATWLLSITLRPGGLLRSVNLVPFSEKLAALACIWTGCPQARSSLRFLVIDVLGNVIVFVPFGTALAFAMLPKKQRPTRTRHFDRRWWLQIAAIGFLFSLGIELAQLFIPTRATDVDDVVLNTVGTLAGAAVARIVRLRSPWN